MENSVNLIYRLKTYSLAPGLSLAEALETIGLLPEQVLAVRSGELIQSDQRLLPGDQIQLISVISGG